jgi:hypothetical protein
VGHFVLAHLSANTDVPLGGGRSLTDQGISNIESKRVPDVAGIRSERLTADGVVGKGVYKLTIPDGGGARHEIIGFSATGLNSGAPVLDTQGRIVGLTSQSMEGAGNLEPYTVFVTFRDWPLIGSRQLSEGIIGVELLGSEPGPLLKALGCPTDRISLWLRWGDE